ncbi:MAG TPA: hypothetical protein VIM62_05000 [Acidobacteriaceae bacterium]
MSRIAIYSRVSKSIAFTMLIAGLTAAQALTPAGSKRPAAVPAEFVITPYGYFHPSCVTRLDKGDEVRKDENVIRHANGAYDSIHVCGFPHFNNKGEKVSDTETADVKASTVKQPTISHAWVEYSSVTTSSSYGELAAEWTVPPAPTTNNGQTVYLFPGMEDYADVVTIIQPVLGWNSDFASAWGIASWNCCKSGTVFEATPQRVNPGDTIYGAMWDTCAAGTLSCPTWDILTYDLTNGKYSELLNTSSQGQTFNWAFAGALEVYNIVQCSNYPPNGSISFHNLYLYNNSFNRIVSPNWSVSNTSSGLTPQCSYGGSISQQINLTY